MNLLCIVMYLLCYVFTFFPSTFVTYHLLNPIKTTKKHVPYTLLLKPINIMFFQFLTLYFTFTKPYKEWQYQTITTRLVTTEIIYRYLTCSTVTYLSLPMLMGLWFVRVEAKQSSPYQDKIKFIFKNSKSFKNKMKVVKRYKFNSCVWNFTEIWISCFINFNPCDMLHNVKHKYSLILMTSTYFVL